MAAVNYKQVACFLTPRQHEDLEKLSAKTLVPLQVILRQAVDKIIVEYELHPNKLPRGVYRYAPHQFS